jgi:hypothetical protein
MDVPANYYYIVIRQRNHLAVMSVNSVQLSNQLSALFDFSVGSNQYYGSDAKELDNGVYGMYSGDANQTDLVTNADKTPIIANLNETGYFNSDLNLTGIVTNADKTPIILNLNKATNVPVP